MAGASAPVFAVRLFGTLLILAGLIAVAAPRLKTFRTRHLTVIGLSLLAIGVAIHVF